MKHSLHHRFDTSEENLERRIPIGRGEASGDFSHRSTGGNKSRPESSKSDSRILLLSVRKRGIKRGVRYVRRVKWTRKYVFWARKGEDLEGRRKNAKGKGSLLAKAEVLK